MSVTAQYDLKLLAREVLSLGLDLGADPTIAHQISGSSGTLTGTTTPAVSAVSSDERTLSAGSDTIDLTAAPGPTVNGQATTVDMTGLVPILVKFAADSGNTDYLTIKKGASNGYDLFGPTGQLVLDAGEQVLLYSPGVMADIDAFTKNIDISSPDVDAKYKMLIVAG